ncbi:hypothetical protein [Actinocatenispora rupis]|uniref:hypothetical protein n=1 Tax=Actinocatenispora rupis TaxID=519421 RepID=UPI0019411639|nr:hypothetical protein [Actinocatenispora rupis]
MRLATAGAAVHLVASIVFAVLARAELEGCDIGDGTYGAFVLASRVDVLLFVAFAVWALVRYGLSAVTATMLAATAVAAPILVYVLRLPSGCPV